MRKERVNEIDLLRFIAAMMVVFYHYCFRGNAAGPMSIMPYPLLAPVSKYGYLGVELFFMISGFVILGTAAQGKILPFLISRFVRLYPAFWICCTITFLVSLALGGTRYPVTLGQYLVNMTMLSEFLHVPSIDGAYWSLFVEMRFYAMVTIALGFGLIHRAQLLLQAWLLAAVAFQYVQSDTVRYLLILDYAPLFIAGATFFLIWSQGFSMVRGAMIGISWYLAVIEATRGLAAFEKRYNTEISSTGVSAVITVFFVVLLLVSLRRTGFFGRTEWLVAGALTYPVYLLHQNIGFMIFNACYPAINPHILLWSTVLVILGAAHAVHVSVERRHAPPLKEALTRWLIRCPEESINQSRDV